MTEHPLGHHFGTVAVNLDIAGENKLKWDEAIVSKHEALITGMKSVHGNVINFGSVYTEKTILRSK